MKLPMFILAVLLIVILLTGGKAFAAIPCDSEPNTGREVVPGIIEYGECEMNETELAELEELESGPMDESMETETGTPEGSSGMAETATGQVPVAVHRPGPTVPTRTPRHVARHTRCTRQRSARRSRRNSRCRSREHRKSDSSKGH